MPQREHNLGPETASINSDVLASVARLNNANQAAGEVKGNARTTAMEAAICIESRFAEATYYDISRWSGRIDNDAKALLIKVLEESESLLKNAAIKSYREAVQKRLEGIRTFEVGASR